MKSFIIKRLLETSNNLGAEIEKELREELRAELNGKEFGFNEE